MSRRSSKYDVLRPQKHFVAVVFDPFKNGSPSEPLNVKDEYNYERALDEHLYGLSAQMREAAFKLGFRKVAMRLQPLHEHTNPPKATLMLWGVLRNSSPELVEEIQKKLVETIEVILDHSPLDTEYLRSL